MNVVFLDFFFFVFLFLFLMLSSTTSRFPGISSRSGRFLKVTLWILVMVQFFLGRFKWDQKNPSVDSSLIGSTFLRISFSLYCAHLKSPLEVCGAHGFRHLRASSRGFSQQTRPNPCPPDAGSAVACRDDDDNEVLVSAFALDTRLFNFPTLAGKRT